MRLLSEVLERVRSLLGRSREARELAEEIRFHVERETEKNVARGLSPAEARRAAHVAFGGVERWTEAWRDERGVAGVERAAREVRLGIRRLVREPAASVPALLTIALGVGACTAVFALVHAVLLRPLPYPGAERLVEIGHTTPAAGLERIGQSPGTYLHYRGSSRSFEDVAVYYENAVSVSVTDGDVPERVRVAMVSPSFFPVLGVEAALGRWFDEQDGSPDAETPGPVIVSHALWVRRYGADPGILRRTIELNQRPRRVVGVMPPRFGFPHPETDVWYADRPAPSTGDLPRDLFLSGVARLRPDVDARHAEEELARLLRGLEASPALLTDGLRPTVVPLRARIVEDVRRPLLLLALTATFVLLVTFANVASLFLVRAERRAREISVARAIGAGGRDLFRRFATEASLMSAAGGALGVLLARAGISARFGLSPEVLPRAHELGFDGTTAAVAAALSIACACVVTGVSLLRSQRFGPVGGPSAASSRAIGDRRWRRAHRALVSVQVALSLALLVASAVMVESLRRLARVEPGFEPGGALTFAVNPPYSRYPSYGAGAALHRELRDRLLGVPGVAGAEAVAWLPLTTVPGFSRDHVAVLGETASEDAPPATLNLVTPGYFALMGIPLIRGVAFGDVTTGAGAPPVVLSQRLAKLLFGERDPVGRQIHLPGYERFLERQPFTVAGVVGDVPGERLAAGAEPIVYFPAVLDPGAPAEVTGAYPLMPGELAVVVRAGTAPIDLVPQVRRILGELDPKLPVAGVGTLEDLVAGATARTRLVTLLLTIAAMAAIGLGVTGVYGIVAYSVSQRTAEIGVRLALGATSHAVVRSVLAQTAGITLAGLAGGVAAAYGLTRALRGQLYEVSPTEPSAYAAAAALLLAVVLLAGWLPARRAGRLDAAEALRAE
jgi:predicted permease